MDKRYCLNNLALAALTTDSGREFQGRTTRAEKNALSALFFTRGEVTSESGRGRRG